MERDTLFRVLIATAVDGIIVIDAQGWVQVFNAACESLFGYSPDEVIGNNVKMLMPAPYQAEHDNYLSNYHDTGDKKIIGIGREVVGQRKDQSTFPMYLSVGERSDRAWWSHLALGQFADGASFQFSFPFFEDGKAAA